MLGSVRTYGVDALITRGSNTYGPFQYPEKLLPLFVTNALDGEPLPLYGDGARCATGSSSRITAPASSSLRGAAREIYNVGGGEEATNREITDLVLEHTGADESLVRRVEDRAGHDRRYSLDTTKARRSWLDARRRARPGLRADGRLVRRQPRLVGADQAVRRLQEYYERQYAARLRGL